MAYAALLSLTQTLDNILLSCDESLDLDEELQIKSLHQKLSLFISFLDETSQKKSDSIEDLEERIRDAVYEAEDIVESHMTKQILSKSEDQNSEDNYEEDIDNVVEKLDSIWGEVEKMKDNNIETLKIKDPPIGPTAPVEVESTSDTVEVEKMQSRNVCSSISPSTNTSEPVVCLEDNILRIKELLVGSSSQLETICIVGMGGIGKTTLARSIYYEPFVSRHFDVRLWITVSKKNNVVALLTNLLKSMGKHTNEMNEEDMEELKLKVYQNLKQRRYLIIVGVPYDFLKKFKNILPDDNTRSRIIMTSRSSKVANFEHYSSHIHPMNFLSPEQSWNLLRQKALGEESCPPEVEEVGRKIAEKCKGLPLSLAVIGGLLYKCKRTQGHWEYVEKNMKSVEVGNYDDLIQVLSWSYKRLPHHLRACFLYMAIYPEDYVIHVSHLMSSLWLAEGFIKPIPPKNLEQVAKEYLDELIDRNLMIVRDRTYYGEIKTCTIHDLIRDLCIRKAREEMFLDVVDKDDKDAIRNQRFLSIYDMRDWYFESAQMSVPTVRSHIYFTDAYWLTRSMHLPLLKSAGCIGYKFRDVSNWNHKTCQLKTSYFILRWN